MICSSVFKNKNESNINGTGYEDNLVPDVYGDSRSTEDNLVPSIPVQRGKAWKILRNEIHRIKSLLA